MRAEGWHHVHGAVWGTVVLQPVVRVLVDGEELPPANWLADPEHGALFVALPGSADPGGHDVELVTVSRR